MKQLAHYQDGRLEIQEVPEPTLLPGGILVRTLCSVISPGTEKMKVEQARMSLLQKARTRPDQVRKVLQTAHTLGWQAAIDKVRNRLDSPTPLGYSAAGEVVAVDALNTRFKVGDRVAVGGAEHAHHAEFLSIPDLLAAKVPDGVDNAHAAHTTLAAIAMQAVRQSDLRLGEQALVIGQGVVGLLVTALLRTSGVRVLATDPLDHRLTVSRQMGAEQTLLAGSTDLATIARSWTQHHGVDAVLLCVGGSNPAVTTAAIDSLRSRGTLVIVGMHRADLEWKHAYMKDIQVRYSRSYGPGRYDPTYEQGGLDYPYSHVRWTENRHFDACLHLMNSGTLNVTPLISREVPFANVLAVYHDLIQPDNNDLGVVIRFPSSTASPAPPALTPTPPLDAPHLITKPCYTLNVIGAGNFVRTMLLPHLRGALTFGSVVNATGLSARHTQAKFGFTRAETDFNLVLGQPATAVLIGTRPHLHAPQVLAALAADHAVFVEKPLCLTRSELALIETSSRSSKGSVMVGFNRRFAPASVALKNALRSVGDPLQIAYHITAGPVDPDHWSADRTTSGGRILGEVCHFLDWLRWITDDEVSRLTAETGSPTIPSDTCSVQLHFSKGSTAQLLYTIGDHRFPKESIRIFSTGFVAEILNFQKLTLYRNGSSTRQRFRSKGHAEEMAAWLAFLKGSARHPLPLTDAFRSTALTFDVIDALQRRAPTPPPLSP